MKNLLFVLLFFVSVALYSQDTIQINQIYIDIMETTYIVENYTDIEHEDYYNQRIKNVLVKYYYVIENEEENSAVWIENHFKPTFEEEINRRKEFINNKNKTN